MSLRRLIYQFPVTIKQYTGMVVDKATITATQIIDRQPSEAAYLFCHFNDLSGTGSVVIAGRDQDDTIISDSLTISDSKPIRSTYMFKTITSIKISGITGKIWIVATDGSHEELRILRRTLTNGTDPMAYMLIQIRDIRDVAIMPQNQQGPEVITSHLGFCFSDLALCLNQFDIVTDFNKVDYKVVYIDIPSTDRNWRVTQAEIGLMQLGSDIND